MDELTKAEIDRINKLYGNDFKDITPDDALLIAKFERMKAQQEGEYLARIEAINKENEQNIKQSKAEHEKAMQNLEELQAKALARLERVENGI